MKIWREIPNFPGYEASIHGEIRSWWMRGGGMDQKPHDITPIVSSSGRWMVRLMFAGKRYMKSVAACVLEAHVGAPERVDGRGMCRIEFVNGNHMDCRLDNLRWAPKEAIKEESR